MKTPAGKRSVQKSINMRKENEGLRLRHYLSTRIRKALKSGRKSAKTMELVGCSIEELKSYIESKFQDGMSWGNWGKGRGKWNVDHIVPCVSFDLTDPKEQKICFHWSNLQPLWEKDNLKKMTKTDGQLMLL